MSRTTILFAVWTVSVFAVIFGIGSLNLPTLSRLSAKGTRTNGVVLALHPYDHHTIDYSYAVEGRSFHGHRAPASPNPSFEQLSVGQSLSVIYDPLQPEVSFPGDPGAVFQNEIWSVGLAAVLMPLFITWAAHRAMLRRQASAVEAGVR